MTDAVAIQVDLELNLEDIRRQGQEVGNILQRSMNRNSRLNALTNLERQIDRVRERVRGIQTDLARAMTEEIPTQEYARMTAQLEQQRHVLQQIIQEHAEIRRITQEEAQAEIFSGKIGASTRNGILSVYQTNQLVDSYQRLVTQADRLAESGRAFTKDGAAISRLREELDRTTDTLDDMIQRHREMSMNSGNAIQNALSPVIMFNQEISQTFSAMQQAFGPYVQIAVQAVTAAINTLVTVTKLEVEALSTLGKVAISAFSPLVSLAKAAGKAVKSIFDSIKKHNETTMKNLWRNVLRYGIGVRSFYFLARKIRNLIGDIIQELAKQIPEVNAQMSAFKTAVNGLKGSLATAFQPILTAVLPALTALINAVSKAIAVVGKFIALLTGQNFVYAATATQVDYAASLEKTGSAAKKAKKELEGYLSPIDEINKYQSKKDDDSGSGGGDAGDFSLTKVPIEDWIKDFWDRIKAAWEHADFTKLGKMLGDKLAHMLANIPWANIRAKARQLGRSLATLLNGIMYGEWNQKSLATYIGETIAGAINTAFDLVDSFVSAFDFSKLGKSIMEIIAGALDNLDWNLITGTLSRLGTGIGKILAEIFNDTETWAKAGEALARAINAIIYNVFNIFNEISGAQVGAAISRFLNKFIEWIDSSAFVTTCNEIMRDMLDALIVAVATTHWDELGEKLAEIISGIDFAGIFKRYARLASVIIDAILDMLEEFLNGLTPDKLAEIGESIAEAINNIDFQPDRLGKVASRLLTSLLDVILAGVNKINWDKLAEDICAILDEIDWTRILIASGAIVAKINEGLKTVLIEAMKQAVSSQGLLGSITNIFNYLGMQVAVAFIQPLLNWPGMILNIINRVIALIKSVLGIHSPSTLFESFGAMCVTGFINGIGTIVDKAKQIWESLKSTTIAIFNGMWNGIKGVIRSIISGVEAMANGIINGFNDAINAINNLQFDVPGWVPIVGGNHLGFNIPTMKNISISAPGLARGAVIPPNKQFLAMLGDQKSGTNIETPLSTMVEAFNTALRQNGGAGGVKQINFVLPDRRTVATYAIEGGRVIQTSTGRNPFELA